MAEAEADIETEITELKQEKTNTAPSSHNIFHRRCNGSIEEHTQGTHRRQTETKLQNRTCMNSSSTVEFPSLLLLFFFLILCESSSNSWGPVFLDSLVARAFFSSAKSLSHSLPLFSSYPSSLDLNSILRRDKNFRQRMSGCEVRSRS